MKTTPGSPFFQAFWNMVSQTARASRWPTTSPLLGLMMSYVVPVWTAVMKASVTATLMLKFVM